MAPGSQYSLRRVNDVPYREVPNAMMLRLSLIASLSLMACTAGNKTTASEEKIYGGQVAQAGEWPMVVALLRNGNIECTGTLVTPALVITAAHCLDDHPDPSVMSIIIGDDLATGQVHRVSKTNINPSYADTPSTDFAYVLLADPAPNTPLVQVLTDPSERQTLLAPGAASTLVGFGEDETGGVGTKRDVVTQVGQPQDGALFIGGGGKDTCNGDSGGPAFGQLATGDWRVYGITSRGQTCGVGGLYATIPDGLCWIEQDSGERVANSELSCDTGKVASGQGSTTLPGGKGTGGGVTPGKLYLALGAPVGQDTYPFFVTAPADTAEIDFCLGDNVTCTANPKDDIPFFQTTTSLGAGSLFASIETLPLTEGMTVTLLGYDTNGNIIHTSTVIFSRN
jgi:hypothetical protein